MRPDPLPDRPSYDPVDLLRQARTVRQHAYAPYSGLRVGAVVVTEDGQVFEGVNMENASYRLTVCAEQAAVSAMTTSGTRSPIVAVAVVGDGADPCTPCGACRQTIFEFGPRATIYASGDAGRPLTATIDELLPHGFGPARLAQGAL